MPKWNFGNYLRLSADDGDKNESNSISTQRDMIKYFLSEHKDIKLTKEYVDDGYTGTDFDRPGFQEMLDDIYSHKINGIIVKDSSRLGRNYIKVGEFLEQVIMKNNIRFISINDGVDSFLKPETMTSLEMYIKNLMNEGYSKDTSKKIRSSFRTSKKHGNYIGAIAPFGYLKDPEDCHKFIVDIPAAEIVKKIFYLALKGYSKQEIVDSLNKSNILTPSKYFNIILKYKIGRIANRWNTRILDQVLKDESYIGSLVQGKRQRQSHKNHNLIVLAEEEWIVVKNHHKPIVSEKMFYQVHDIFYNRNIKIKKDGSFAPYNGYIKCADCKSNLYRKTKKKTNQSYYYCGTYIRTHSCTKHYITEDELNTVVLEMINKYIELLSDLKDRVEKIINVSSVEYDEDIKRIKIIEIDKDMEQQEKLINELIKDYNNNLITKEDFEDYHKEYLFELNNLRIKKDELEKREINQFNMNWLKDIKNFDRVTTITKNVVNEYIDNIYIYENKRIKIDFKYQDPYNEAIRYLKNRKV